MRKAQITRKTAETEIAVEIALDGTGTYSNETGVGFFDHMLDQLSRHSLIDIRVRAKGDLHIDDHHTVEDTGIALGQALAQALGDKKGIRRYGHFTLAMDDAQVATALDLSGRPYLVWSVDFPTAKIGTFDTELVREFFQALSTHGGITLHVDRIHGINSHHIAEAAFKSVARALRMAVEPDPRADGRAALDQGGTVSLTVVVDYDSGNLHSAEKAFQRMAAETGSGFRHRLLAARGCRPRRPDRAAGRRRLSGLPRRARPFHRAFRGDRGGCDGPRPPLPRHLHRHADDGDARPRIPRNAGLRLDRR